MFNVPILYIVFNRPKETQQSFEAIRKAKPTRLYVAADGPRANRLDDGTNSEQVKNIIDQVDWECEVFKLYQPQNLGCRIAVETALDWFFENEEEGIILEDDIIPNEAFFEFCEAMLQKYRNDSTVFSINGCSLGYQNAKVPYGATRYFNMWGWATWRRSLQSKKETWGKYNPNDSLENDATIKRSLHLPVLSNGNKIWRDYWATLFYKVYHHQIDTWDYQWIYSVLKTNSFCIRPSQNYVINIGSGEQATHHTFSEAPIFNFVYTANHFQDVSVKKLKIDYDYEIIKVGSTINSHYFKSLRRKFILNYIKTKFKIEKAKLLNKLGC